MKSISTIEAEITRIKDELSKLQMKQDKLTLKLKELQEQKRNYEAKEIMDAYLKSGKSYEELMTFLQV
jgi:septal ring factor EnvC (AmiA/AmiB activator)